MEFLKNWGGHLLSLFGIIGGLILYFKHDKRIKSHEEQLLKLQIEEINQSKEDAKKANVMLNLVKNSNSSWHIKIFNTGKATARNVYIEIEDRDKMHDVYFFNNQWGPYESIVPQYGSVEEKLILYKGQTKQFYCNIKWDDDYAQNRTARQPVYLR